jgi:transporter family protein
MENAVLLAMAASCFITANDLIYRKSAIGRNLGSIFSFYFLASLASCLLALGLGCATGKAGFTIETVDVLFGIGMGALSFITYILFLFSFSGSNTTVTVTIFRLNMIPGILLAMVFIGETISWVRGIGILLCIAALLLFVGKVSGERVQMRYLPCSLGACLAGGVLSILNKVAVMQGVEPLQVMFWRFLTVGAISGVLLWVKGPRDLSLKVLGYALASGFLLMFSVLLTMTALKTGDVSVVIPITQLAFVLVALFSWIALKEKMNIMKGAGVLCAILAVFLIR